MSAGDSEDNIKQYSDAIRFKYTGEFADRSQYSIDICTDPHTIMTLLTFMIELKKAYSDMVIPVDSTLKAYSNIMTAISKKVGSSSSSSPNPSWTPLSGFSSIVGPFTDLKAATEAMNKMKSEVDKQSPAGSGEDLSKLLPFGLSMDQVERIVDKMTKVTDVFKPGDKGYTSVSPEDWKNSKFAKEKDKIFSDDKANPDEEKEKKEE